MNATKQYQAGRQEDVILDHLSQRLKRREVNKERPRHDTHHAIHKEVYEVHPSDLSGRSMVHFHRRR